MKMEKKLFEKYNKIGHEQEIQNTSICFYPEQRKIIIFSIIFIKLKVIYISQIRNTGIV